MNKLLRNIIILSMLITEAVFCCTYAQTKVSFAYDTDFLLYFDNREYDRTPPQRSQTIFGVRLAPEIGVQIADSTESTHKLMAGVSYNQPFGASWGDITVKPTIYYRIETKGFDLNLGFVPYRYLKKHFRNICFQTPLAIIIPIYKVHFSNTKATKVLLRLWQIGVVCIAKKLEKHLE